MNDLVSIVVPIYNVENYLNHCVETLKKQTYSNIEIILVDDGSPDNCGKICDELAKKDSRIVVVHKSNGGLSDARNAGIDVSNGSYIMFVDSDDYVADNMVERCLIKIKQDESDVVIFNHYCVNTNGEIYERTQDYPEILHIMSGTEAVEKIYQNETWYFVMAWNKMYRSSLFANLRFPVGKLHEDEFTSYKVLYESKKVSYLKDALYYYTISRDGSIMGTKYSYRNMDKIEALLERTQFFLTIGDKKMAAMAAVRGIAYLHEAWTKLDLSVVENAHRYNGYKTALHKVIRGMDKQFFSKVDKIKILLFYTNERIYEVVRRIS